MLRNVKIFLDNIIFLCYILCDREKLEENNFIRLRPSVLNDGRASADVAERANSKVCQRITLELARRVP